MKEIWELAIQSHNLPLTCVVGVFMLYWITCIIGVIGVDAIDVDLDFDANLDADADIDGGLPGPIVSMLRFVNAADVPLMAILTLLSLYTWVLSMMGNYYLNPDLVGWLILTILTVAFIIAVPLVKISTIPAVPLFRKMKELEKAEPAIGGIGIVISRQLDQKYGQVELQRKDGAPAILNCRISDDTSLDRGTEVAILSYDQDKGTYLVRKI